MNILTAIQNLFSRKSTAETVAAETIQDAKAEEATRKRDHAAMMLTYEAMDLARQLRAESERAHREKHVQTVANALLDLQNDGIRIPYLHTETHVSDDGQTVTFKIANGDEIVSHQGGAK